MARGRPATPLGTWGEITHTQLPNGKTQASTYLRLHNGKTVRIRATAKSKTAATTQLKQRCQQRLNTQDTTQLTHTSTLTELLTTWIKQHDVSERSKHTYTKAINLHITPNIGNIRLNEITTQQLQQFLDTLTPGTAKTSRAVLGSACTLAIQWNIMPRNPVRDTKLRRHEKQPVHALTTEEITQYKANIAKWIGGNGYGPQRGDSLLEIIDVCHGTGARIGEVLGLRWQDVDLDNATMTISGQVDSKGGRKSTLKTKGSYRTIRIAPVALEALKRQWEKPARQWLGEAVFPTRSGTYRTVSNVEGDLREARGDLTITPHNFRKTVATAIEQKYGMLAASRHLGHSSTRVTEQAYLARPEVLPDWTDVI
ncbi:tyrosine recombinase XerC [Corynebacterium diphtheriae]|uniref:tyrosine-type recombinase/integrase n=1 Tax=Corynebacterium diphtheriae TaxID=1717 RepID=UPI0013C8FBB5|nr:site-specific integrase [Corynebacterium diphtheriae bv. mitis]CAB0811953.1 tyrosine recombinase XerC [Corynebacterium diphtheriae]